MLIYYNFFKDLFNKSYLTIFLLVSIWFSLDVSLSQLKINPKININELYVTLRIILPYIFFTIYLFFYYKKIIVKNRNTNLIFIFSILIFLSQAIGLFTTKNSIQNIGFIFSSLFYLFLINILINKRENIDIVFKTGIFFLILLLSIYGFEVLEWYYTSTFHLNLYGSWPHAFVDVKFLSSNVPRSSGLSRMAIILFIYFTVRRLAELERRNFFYILIFTILTLFIVLTQSRTNILFYLGYSIILIILIFLKKKKFTKKFFEIFIIFIIPLCFSTLNLKYKNVVLENYLKNYSSKGEHKAEIFGKSDVSILRRMDEQSFTSNRFTDWSKIIKNNKSPIFGNGSMGDRFLIDQTASNGFLYIYASAGFFGILFYSFIFLKSFISASIILSKTKIQINHTNFKILICCAIILYLLFRSLVETSFANFGIDFLIFFISFFYIELKKEKFISSS